MRDDIATLFDSLADRWDELAVHPRERLDRILGLLGDIEGASVLDVGSGTGVLLGPLLALIGPGGRVLALDISPRMIALARGKRADARLDFAVADFLAWEPPRPFDLLVAYSCYPHFLDQEAFWAAAARCLKPGGRALVAHIEGRDAINAMHGEAGRAVSRPLPSIGELARMAAGRGFAALAQEDSEDSYYLLADRLRG